MAHLPRPLGARHRGDFDRHRAAPPEDGGGDADRRRGRRPGARTLSADHAHERALVLGGGGSAGNAWLIGVVAGFAAGGLDVTTAELVVGTSAGATTAAQILGRSPGKLLEDLLSAPVPPARQGGPTLGQEHLDRFRSLIAASSDAADMRRRVSEAALAADVEDDGSRSERWRAMAAARIPITDWPDAKLVITAVDARTAEPITLDRDSGIGLADAIAASTSGGGLAHHVGDQRYLDGGYRRNENADVAFGYGRVLVLSPLSGRTLHPLEWRMQLAAQVEDLEDEGSQVATVVPDEASLAAIGENLMDPSTRVPAARAGYEQGRGAAPLLLPFWE